MHRKCSSFKTLSTAQPGFALIIALVLMGLIVSLILSLSSLTLIETASVNHDIKQSAARENAKFALLEALGQLQRYAGPDQRVTARADINAANANNPSWTGVWNATPADLDSPTHAQAPASNAPMAWLVNGGSGANAIAASDAAVADPDGSNNNVWLVKSILGSTFDVSQPVKLASSEILGAASNGRYAYWVGDVGVMASLTVTNDAPSPTPGSDEQLLQFTVAPEFGGDMLPGLADVYQAWLETASEAQAKEFRARLSRLSNYDELLLLGTDDVSVSGQGIAYMFGDVSVVSSLGVLADTMRGGLRRDLTRGLDDDLSLMTEPAASELGGGVKIDFGNLSDTGERILPNPGPVGQVSPSSSYTRGREVSAPTWELVRSYLENRASDSGDMAPVFAPFSQLDTYAANPSNEHAIMPIVTMIEFRFGVDFSGANYMYVVQPNIILCNPYNVALTEADYCVTYEPINSTGPGVGFQVYDTSIQSGALVTIPDLRFSTHLGSSKVAFNITDSFEPGEVKISSLPVDQEFDATSGGVIDLQNGYTAANILIDTGIAVDPNFTLPDSQAKIELQEIDQNHPTISIAGGKATVGALPTPTMVARYIETEPKWMDIKYDKDNPTQKQTKPYARMKFIAGQAPTNAHSLLTFRFSLTTPANDYLTHGNQPGSQNHRVPSGHDARTSGGGTYGQLTHGMRSLIDANPRAMVAQRLGGWDNTPTYHFNSYRDADYLIPVSFDGDHGFWGGSQEDDGNGVSYVALFDVLRDSDELVSLGQLAHVNWGVGAKHPTYPLGNSYASIFYEHDARDFSYALNEAIWDRYFFSSLPNVGLETPPDDLPNSRLLYYDVDAVQGLAALEGVSGYDEAAAHMLVRGAFNINSTSVNAWAAFLGSIPESDYAFEDLSGDVQGDDAVRPYLRLRRIHGEDPRAEQGMLYEWSGYRTLSDEEIMEIAEEIVEGIKARGRPARSLAEFLNRDLNLPADDLRNQKGIVQAAIDQVVNQDDPSVAGSGQAALADLPGLVGSTTLTNALIVAETFRNADNPEAARGKLRATGAPGFVMQSDLITPLAPAMSARSDTFVIRAYGDTRNRLTGDVEARAWCEAYVQRLPDYVGSEAPETALVDLANDSPSKDFGRRFVITSFRWLNENEI